jgi:signal peptidase I
MSNETIGSRVDKFSKKYSWKKATKKIGSILLYIVISILVGMTLLVASTRVLGGEPEIFGYQIKTVLSGSMAPTFETGSLIIVKEVKDPSTLNIGDVITYKANDNTLVTHRIKDIQQINDSTYYHTKGDNNENPDFEPITGENIVGKYTGISIPLVGYFLNFAGSPMGIALLLIIPGLMLIVYSVYSIRLLLKELEQKEHATSS